MISSMTGFSRVNREGQLAQWSWELRSVNHRYLETSLRLPEACKALEAEVRKRAGAVLKRGKVEISLRYHLHQNDSSPLQLNRPLLEQLRKTEREVLDIVHAGHAMNVIDYLKWPGVLLQDDVDLSDDFSMLMELLDEALQALLNTRQSEGAALQKMIEERLDAMHKQHQRLCECRPQLLQGVRSKLDTALNNHLGENIELDPGRLEQELVILAQKLDVDEELDRLQAHINEVRKVLKRDEAIGRRLDFLMQELNREANTLSSKSQDIETTQIAVDMKVLIEQMREQVQNIE